MNSHVREFLHRGVDAQLEFQLGNDWGGHNTPHGDQGRLLVLEKFLYIPAQLNPDVQGTYPEVITMHIEGGRGKYLKNGFQTNIVTLINAMPTLINGQNIPIYQYNPQDSEHIELSPFDNKILITLTDENDNPIAFTAPYTIGFSITNGFGA